MDNDYNEIQSDPFLKALFAKLGYTTAEIKRGIFAPVVEAQGDGKMFIKFMSNHGKRDAEQGTRFRKFLLDNKVRHAHREARIFSSIHTAALEKAVGVKLPNE